MGAEGGPAGDAERSGPGGCRCRRCERASRWRWGAMARCHRARTAVSSARARRLPVMRRWGLFAGSSVNAWIRRAARWACASRARWRMYSPQCSGEPTGADTRAMRPAGVRSAVRRPRCCASHHRDRIDGFTPVGQGCQATEEGVVQGQGEVVGLQPPRGRQLVRVRGDGGRQQPFFGQRLLTTITSWLRGQRGAREGAGVPGNRPARSSRNPVSASASVRAALTGLGPVGSVVAWARRWARMRRVRRAWSARTIRAYATAC